MARRRRPLVLHHGRAGERGHAERLPAGPCGAGERLAALAARQRRCGYRELEHCEMRLPCSSSGRAARALFCGAPGVDGRGAVLDGPRRLRGYEHDGALTIMGESVHAGLAVRVLAAGLAGSVLPEDALIAVSAGEDVIAWPPARVGEALDAP